ncbi:mutator type transposase [Tanacetum coccineum]
MLAATWSLRPDGHTLDSYKEYCNHPTAFTLKINHGGQLTCPPNVRYIGGKANWFDDVDADTFSTIEVQTMVKDLGYIHTDLMLYYKIPKLPLHNGLKSLACDKDVMEMCQYVSQCKLMEVFVIHPISEPDLVDNGKRGSGSSNVKRPSGSNKGKRPIVIEDDDGSDSSEYSGDSEDSDDSDFDIGDEDIIGDVDVDMDDFRKHTNENVEWIECTEKEVQVPPPFDYEEVDLEEFGSGTDNGFKAGKRDLLGLDGCFLSGPYPGQILTAVGVDPNNGIYPLAYAVVEGETKESWLWFLDCLGDDLELFRNSNFTFISDRQKVTLQTISKFNKILTYALQETFPVAEHRYCLKHIYDNMKLQWRGEQYKDLLWRSATATTVQRFGKNMEEIKKLNPEMYNWLKDIPPQHWARSHFFGRTKESWLWFLDCLGDDLELFRNSNFTFISDRQKGLIPALQEIFPAAEHRFASIWNMENNGLEPGIPESWVHESYWLKTWVDMYRFKVNPCNGPELWPESDTPITLTAPNYKPPIGRPKKKRRKSAAEIYDNLVKRGKLSRAGGTVTCLKCGQQGHNQRSCKGQRHQGSHAPPAVVM